MMSVRSPQCSMPSSSPFLKEESASCMRIRDMTGKRFASRSASGVTLQESHGRSADAGVLRRIDAGSWKRRTPGSTDSESSWSDMRNYLKATRRSSISLLRSSVGGRWQLFTDKSLVKAIVNEGQAPVIPAGYSLKGWRSGACFGAGSTARMLGTARLRTELRWRR